MLRVGIIEMPGNKLGQISVRTFDLFQNKIKFNKDEEQPELRWQQGRIISLPSYYSLFSGDSLKIAAERHSGVKILSEKNQEKFIRSVSKRVCSCFPVLVLMTLDREKQFSEKSDLRPYFESIECSLVDDH